MAAAGWSRSWWPRGIRARSVTAAVAVVAVALVVAGAALLLLLRWSLVGEVDAAVAQRSRDLAAEIAVEPADDPGLMPSQNADVIALQVQSLDGQLLAANGLLSDGPLPVSSRPAPGTSVHVDIAVPAAGGETYRAVATGAQTARGPVVVVAAQSLAGVHHTLSVVAALLVAATPVLLGAVGWATYVAVGRSLHAVEAIRRGVARIESTDLHQRVPVPATGDEIARLATTMNGMLARLEESSRAQRQFVADAGHELRSPLASLVAAIEVAEYQQEQGSPAWAETAPVLRDEVARLSRFVDDLLVLAKADEHQLTLHLRDVDLDHVVEIEAARVRATTTLRVTGSIEAVRVTADPGRIAQVVRNLVDNAIRHAESGVALSVSTAAHQAVVTVDDDGPGVAEAERERILERFVRLDEHRGRDSGGSGLGLSIAQEIAIAHGGSIRVAESPSGGARVELILPRD
ncbi:MAG: HAMP domain-containing protein [Actinomycetota bacterium]|nr:MAG: HAMP domain-containing protein [Actinomycetota bacterium]